MELKRKKKRRKNQRKRNSPKSKFPKALEKEILKNFSEIFLKQIFAKFYLRLQ